MYFAFERQTGNEKVMVLVNLVINHSMLMCAVTLLRVKYCFRALMYIENCHEVTMTDGFEPRADEAVVIAL